MKDIAAPDAKLNELDKDEMSDVSKKLDLPADFDFEAAWAEFIAEKKRRALTS